MKMDDPEAPGGLNFAAFETPLCGLVRSVDLALLADLLYPDVLDSCCDVVFLFLCYEAFGLCLGLGQAILFAL
jgi:hypothetical protein